MSPVHRLLFLLTSFRPCRIINGPDQAPYLERYHLFRLPFGGQVYVHRFVASDPGRCLHNHPWNGAFSLILSGEYEETRMADAKSDHALLSRRLVAGSFNWISGRLFHRIDLADNAECWTLFIHGHKAKSWGFLKTRQQYAFHDHREMLQLSSNPRWWKTADRPRNCPSMRKPLEPDTGHCIPV